MIKRKKVNHLKEYSKIINKDKELKRAWNDNLAMAYKDNYAWYQAETGKKVLNREDRHIVANRAAAYFLELLFGKIKHIKGR